jgi:diaminopimelate decarboxylase
MSFQQPVTHIQGVSLLSIIEEFGSPVYVYDANKIIQQIQSLKNAFDGTDNTIKFAAKALTNVQVLKLMKQNGVGVDVVSFNEGKMAELAGFLPEDIMLTPSNVSRAELQAAVETGYQLNLDSIPAIETFGQLYGPTKKVAVRINPGVMAGGNYKISTGHSQSKFGIAIQQLPELLTIVDRYKININGLHVHTGSEITDVDVFMQVADILLSTANQFDQLEFIDFGGGFKVAYKENDRVTDIDLLGKSLVKKFNDFCLRYGKKLKLYLEPGKFLVSEAGYFLTTVTVVKPTPTITFIGVDSGLNHLIRPMMYDAYHHIMNISTTQAETATYNVVGNICETDTLGAERILPITKVGDILSFYNAGAYGFTMASNYNARVRPAEVLVENGKARLIRRRENLDDLLRTQIL